MPSRQTIGEVDLTFQGRVYLKQNVKENGREQGLTDKDVARKFAKEQATARMKAAIVLLNNAQCELDRVRARERR